MNAPGARTLRIGPGVFDPLSGELSLDGRTVKLRPRTAALLGHLALNSGRVVTKDELMSVVWPDAIVTEDSIVQCVKEIRQALGPAGRDWIRTLPRQGYAFVGGRVPAAPAQPPEAHEQHEPPSIARWRTWPAWAAVAGLMGAVAALAWIGWTAPTSARGAPERSMVVLPVANLTGDASQDDAADDLTDAITDTLARGGHSTVIASSTAFAYKGRTIDVRRVGVELNVRYVVQGVLRREGAQAVLTMRLVDADRSVQLWQQDFRVGHGGLPELREDVMGGITANLGMKMIEADARRSDKPGAMEAAELLSRARGLMRAGSDRQQQLQARALLERSVQLDDGLATSWVMLAASWLYDVRFSPTRTQQLERAAAAVQRAVAITPTSDGVRLVQGTVAYEQGNMVEALRLYDLALELNGNNAAALGRRASTLIMLGRPQEAFAPLEQAMRLSPRDPQMVAWCLFGGTAHLHLGDDATAIDWLARGAALAPSEPFNQLFLSAALANAGRIEEARARLARFQQLEPGFTLTRFRAAEPSREPAFLQQRQHLYDGLRRAGMPE